MQPPNWQQIFSKIRDNVLTAVKPWLETLKQPLPDLGRGAGGDLTKPVDLAAENAIVETVKEHGVSFMLISEEAGIQRHGSQSDDCYLCLDPVDGTTNLMHGLPFYASSIAVASKPQLANVYAAMVVNLFSGVTYMAYEGKGASCNGRPIATSKTTSLDEALVGLDVNTYKTKADTPTFTAIIENTKHTRHFGANALEVCYVAEGASDAFIDLRSKIRTTDVAAGFLIVKEAGGIVTDPKNQPINVKLDPRQTLDFVASANPQIHQAILSLIKPPC